MTAAAGGIVLAARVLFSVFFVNAGYGYLKNRSQMEAHSRHAGFLVPLLAGWPAGLWLLVAAASVAIGIWPDGSLMIGALAPERESGAVRPWKA